MKKNEPLFLEKIILPKKPDYHIIKKAIHDVKGMLSEAGIILNSEFNVEYSHHYGVEKFKEIGVTIINIINREYCKKILVQLPEQKHPSHHHKLKEETFLILSGTLDIVVDGNKKTLYPGDKCLVLPGVWHSCQKGCIFEEISTTHYNNDSVYKDKINLMKRESRKTLITGKISDDDSIRKVVLILKPYLKNAKFVIRMIGKLYIQVQLEMGFLENLRKIVTSQFVVHVKFKD